MAATELGLTRQREILVFAYANLSFARWVPPRVLQKLYILKEVKVFCFDTLLQVLILCVLALRRH
jgi:hypothetical protein